MKNIPRLNLLSWFSLCVFLSFSCRNAGENPTAQAIKEISLRRGDVVLCGPADQQFGLVTFETSCSGKAAKDFDLAVSLLHSFEYDEAEKVFAKIIDASPGCAMAYWGVAMCNYHPVWTPPTDAELEKGSKAVNIAKSLTQTTKRESAYINAIGAFYENWDKVDHHTRSIAFEKGMEKICHDYPDDIEAVIFYALSLNAAADPADITLTKQKKAGQLLSALYAGNPNHPGIVHYIIHSYDYPELAALALPAARHYAAIAPSSSHAQHMPSHIFTRMGLWTECIASNLAAVSSARCYAVSAQIKGHWDEELHGMDYLVYAYLQKGEVGLARKQCEYLDSIEEVYPVNFKVAYAFAAIPARYVLENKSWEQAAALQIHPVNFPWQKFPWQQAITHFTRLLGAVHIGHLSDAKKELTNLVSIHDTLTGMKDLYKANQVQIQIMTGGAWIAFKEGKYSEAIDKMKDAADQEDKTQKHPVTPGEVIPARELLGDMFYLSKQMPQALKAYEEDLRRRPNRFNALYGAARSAQAGYNFAAATGYYHQLLDIANAKDSKRPELDEARSFLKMQRR